MRNPLMCLSLLARGSMRGWRKSCQKDDQSNHHSNARELFEKQIDPKEETDEEVRVECCCMHIADAWFRGGEGSNLQWRNHGQPVCEKWLARHDVEERRPWRYRSKCSHGQEKLDSKLRQDRRQARPGQ